MTQTLRSQPIPIAATNVYCWQHSLDQLQSHSRPHISSAKRSRNRGVILSPQGWQKLMQAGVLNDKFGNRYTYEQLSERAGLDERTVSRLLSCEVKVDKRTLKTFFRAFDLPLEAGDCTLPKSDRNAATTLDTATDAVPNKQMLTLDHLVEELIQLKQRVRDYERLFNRFGLNESYLSQQEA